MRRSTRLLLAAALLAFAIALAACGGGDETTSTTSPAPADTVPELQPPAPQTTTSPPEATTSEAPTDDATESGGEASTPAPAVPTGAEGVIEAVLTGSVPAKTICDDLLTVAFLKTAYGSREGCLAGQVPGALAAAVEVTRLDEAAGKATVVLTGGPVDGVEVAVGLVDDGGGIRVDSVIADVPAGP